MVAAEQVEKFGAGMCVYRGEKNGYDDSDFYGIFAVPAEPGTEFSVKGYHFRNVETGSTRHAGGFIATVDATEEVKEAYRAWVEAQMESIRAERAANDAKIPEVGTAVTVIEAVTRGKNKVAAGEVGVVFWRGGNRYGDMYGAKYDRPLRYRVGIELFDGTKVFVSEDRVAVQGHEHEERPLPAGHRLWGLMASTWPAIR
jgi:hypothetical protein